MPHQLKTLICADCPHWRRIHGTVGQCRLQEPHMKAESVFAYPMTHEAQACIHGQPPVVASR